MQRTSDVSTAGHVMVIPWTLLAVATHAHGGHRQCAASMMQGP